MEWLDDTLVVKDGSLFTVRGSNLELRGNGWDRRRKRGDTENTDLARICHLESNAQARKIAELVAATIEDQVLSRRSWRKDDT